MPDVFAQPEVTPETSPQAFDVAKPDIAMGALDAVDSAMDATAVVDAPTTISDGPLVIDGPPVIDGLQSSIDGLRPDRIDSGALTIDGAQATLPDGRVILVVDACEIPNAVGPSTTGCANSFDQVRAGMAVQLDADPPLGRAIGRCAEGAWVFSQNSVTVCYYDPTWQARIAVSFTYGGDLQECSQAPGTFSETIVFGTRPPCTSITWETSW